MYDVRLGSYSIAATLAGMSSLRRLKSMRRYRRLAPPPRWREVLRPYELRPPLFFRPSVSDFSGVVFVISAKSGYETKRIPGDVGLGLRIGMRLALLEALERGEDRDRVALAHLNDGLLPGPRPPRGEPAPLGLGLHRGGADLEDLDVEERLDGLADLRLVRVGMDAERVLVGGGTHVALPADDGADDHLAGIHQAASSCRSRVGVEVARAVSASSASCERTIAAAPITSATPTPEAGRTETRAMLRNDRAARSWSSARTTSTEPASRSPSSTAASL